MKGSCVSSDVKRYLLLTLCALAAIAAVRMQQPRIEGEYGLRVVVGDSLVVQWLTADSAPGMLIVRSGRRADSIATAPGRAHRAALLRPRGDSILLRYGRPGDGGAATPIFMGAAPRRTAATYPAADSLYIVGDTHGDFDALVTGLRRAGLVDEQLRWTGRRKRLVFAGDLTDRGPDVIRLLWFVYRLERDAERQGGRVHVVLGNHELMVMLGDLRYVHAKEQEIARAHGISYYRMFDPRVTVLGRWLAAQPAVIRIGRVAIAHGGVAPEYATGGVRAINDTLAKYAAEDLFYYWSDTTATIQIDSASYAARERFLWGPGSVFWHRDYVQSDSTTAQLDAALRALDADVMVVGHTAVPEITAMHDGRLIAVHTPRFGAELLLLTRERRYRITAQGTQPF
jgi:hypothetical protein